MISADPSRQGSVAATPFPAVLIAAPSNRSTGIVSQLKELWRARVLLQTLVLRELRLRYKNSSLGILWSLLNPLLMVFTYTVVFSYILGAGPSNMSSYIFCGILPWIWFSTSVLDASSSIQSYAYLLKKIYFPREILPLVSICANFVHFLVALAVFLVYRYGLTTLIFGWPGPPPLAILWMPVVIVIEFFLIAGISFIVSALNVFYEDVKFLLTAVTSILFYFVPILYFAENIMFAGRIPAHWRWAAYHLYLGDPIAWIVESFKQMFFVQQNVAGRGLAHRLMSAPFDWRYLAITAATSLIVFFCGYSFFNSRKWKFAERP